MRRTPVNTICRFPEPIYGGSGSFLSVSPAVRKITFIIGWKNKKAMKKSQSHDRVIVWGPLTNFVNPDVRIAFC